MTRPDGLKTARSESSTKINRDNVEFQEYLLRCKPGIPCEQYTDEIFASGLLNSLLIRVNKVVVFLFYNCINASLQSANTITRRRMLRTFESVTRNDLSLENNSLLDRRSSTSEEDVAAHGNQASQLSLPTRNKFAFAAVFTLQVLIWLHYVCAQTVLNNPYNKKYGITSSRSLETCQTLVEIVEEPVTLRKSQSSGEDGETSVQMASCLRHLEIYILERYDQFYVWNMSVSFVFEGPLMEDFLLVEQSVSLQMFSDEVTLFCHTIGIFFFTSGILGCILAEHKPYDVAPMIFIYEPRYTIHHMKSRIRHYFNIMRASYVNYWSIYHLDESRGLCRFMSSSLHRYNRPDRLTMKSNVQTAPIYPTSIYHAERFEHYIPSSRGGIWRHVLMVSSALYQIIASTLASVTLTILYIFFVAGNDGATEMNEELKQFLRAGAEPLGLDEVLSEHCLVNTSDSSSANEAIDASRNELSSYVRWKMIEYFSNILRRLSPDLSMLKLDVADMQSTQPDLMDLYSLPLSILSWPNNRATDFERDPLMQMHRRLVLNAIQPVKKPTLINWTVPFIGGFMTGLLFSLYFAIYFSVIADLSYWLFEIRMKLDICKLLLKYQDKEARGSKQIREATLGSFSSFTSRMDKLWPGDVFNDHQERKVALAHLDGFQTRRVEHSLKDRQLSSKRPECSPVWHQSLRQPSSSSVFLSDKWPPALTDSVPHYTTASIPDESARDLHESRQAGTSSSLAEDQTLKKEILSNCNTGFWEVIRYVISSRSKQRTMCDSYARNIIQADLELRTKTGLREFKECSDSFLLSAYLDFRLFLEQIETCRFSINFMLSYTMLHALNIIAASHFTELMRSKVGFLACGYVLANITLLGSSFFQSQCTKLISPIYSILASSLNTDKTIKHLSSLWRRALVDLSGSRSKFSFRVYSFNISYATALQFNLGVTSLYILLLDKTRYRL